MNTDQTIDIEQLLNPISSEEPAGQDPRGLAEWTDLKQARQSKGDNDPFGETEVEPADWALVIELASRMLTERGKHIETACDLTEALIRERGLAGLRDGLRLVRELQERYWDAFYPALDTADEMAIEESLLDRAGPLNGLNTNIVNAMSEVLVTGAKGMDNFSWLLYNDSRYVENEGRRDPGVRATLITDGRADPDLVNSAVAATNWKFYEAGLQCLQEASEERRLLDNLLDERYTVLRDEGPSLQGIREAIDDLTTFFEITLKQKKPAEMVAADGAESEVATSTGNAGAAQVAGGVPLEPRDRADAIRRLRAVAAFFHRTEPHSPVSHLVQRAATWGEMSLQQWLQEVVKDPGTLGQIRETLGIKEGEEQGGGGGGGGESW